MRIRRSFRKPQISAPGRTLAAYWSLKILLDLGAWRNLLTMSNDEPIFHLIGMQVNDSYSVDLNKGELLRFLKQRKRQLARESKEWNDVVSDNLERLSRLVGLSETEQIVLAVAVLLKLHTGFEEALETLGDLNRGTLIRVLAAILDLRESEVQTALCNKGRLFRSGLLRLDHHHGFPFQSGFEPLEGLTGALTVPHSDTAEMLREFFHRAPQSTLSESDFQHLGNRFQTLRRYLAHTTEHRPVGANILLYGPPGTGKTELARTLAHVLDVDLYEVTFVREDGDPQNSGDRSSAYQLCQQILSKQQKVLILFDEIEDVLEQPFPLFFPRGRDTSRHKAWFNWLLEENPVPTIWICNDIDRLNSAFIRRFDQVIEMEHPPLQTRAQILQRHLNGMPVSSDWIERIAENPDIAPAVITRAAKVAEVVGGNSEHEMETTLEEVLIGTLRAMGYQRPLSRSSDRPFAYRLEALNPDQDLNRVLNGLKQHPHGRLCLYGPPGTGKTEFGRHLSQYLEKPLLQKRASDLLSPFVGQTEQQIAKMFLEAERDNAVLLLDEADSFLQDRTGAHHSWEVTKVNELLTQMEAYDGIFLCSTNLVETLDKASLRRFDLKIRFGYLRPDQAWMLFREIVGDEVIDPDNEQYWRKHLGQLGELTPGDFGAVVRRSRMLGQEYDAEGLMVALEAETAFKLSGRGREIGFLACF